jgi:S-layer protein (TIGR01567 family)
MKKYTAVLMTVLTVFVAIAAGTVSAADNVSNGSTICNVVPTNYECESWSDEQYPVIDLFGDKYVPLFTTDGNIWDSHVNKLASLILDSNETYTLKPGETLDLGNGYALEVREIDIDSEKIWFGFTKDGQKIADQTVSVSNDNNKTWTLTLDGVQGENSIVVMKVYVNNLFVGAVDNIVRIDGIWLIEYANAITLNAGDKVGEFTLKEIINGTGISNPGSLVFENTTGDTAGNIENYTVSSAGNTTESSVTCNVVAAGYACDHWSDEQYPVLDLFGSRYVPLFTPDGDIWDSHINKLASLVLDSNETHTLKPGETLDLGNGYALEVREIDVDSEKVWLEFTKDGQCVADQNIPVDADGNSTWTVALDNVQGENDIVVMKVNIKQVFVGTETSVIWVDGVWLIDYANSRTLNLGDKLGEFTLEEIINGVDISNPGSLIFKNTTFDDDLQSYNLSGSVSNEKGRIKVAGESEGSFNPLCWNFWRFISIKSR